MAKKRTPLKHYIIAPLTMMTFFTTTAVVIFLLSGDLVLPIAFVYIGLTTVIGMLLFILLPYKRKHFGRLLGYFMIGVALFLGMGVMGRINIQIEGVFFQILAGVIGGAITHFLMAKFIGAIFIHRIWCSWACWTMAILDLFPYRRSPGRLPGKWGWLRYAHFLGSFALITILYFGFNYGLHEENFELRGLYWFLGSNALYYIVGIIFVLAFKDNRAFCKYLCPVSLVLKSTSAFSILKIKGKNELCTNCKACVKVCPMDIQVPKYHQMGKRVLTSECIICLSCVDICPTGTLSASLGVDFGTKGHLRMKEPEQLENK